MVTTTPQAVKDAAVKIVPVEPTEAMLLAAYNAACDHLMSGDGNEHCKSDEERSAHSIRPLYRAMLDAAPIAPDDRDEAEVDFGFASYKDRTFELIARNRKTGEEVLLHGQLRPEQTLEQIDKVLPTCVYVTAKSDRDEKIRKAVEAVHAAYIITSATTVSGVHAEQAKRHALDAINAILTELTGGQKP